MEPTAATSDENKKVKLQSSDEKIVEVPFKVACMSVTIKNMLEDIAELDTAIPLPNVKEKTLGFVVRFCTQHTEHPETDSKFTKGGKVDNFSEWDAKFVAELKQDLWVLFETILAANYLDIKPLLDVTCRAVAGMIKGKSPEEICKTFNIRTDATEAELEEVRKANPWLDEL